jgi:hypothetical protein
MTKVFLNRFILSYRQEMVEAVCDIIKGKFIVGVKYWGSPAPPLAQADLLTPPTIEILELRYYQGRIDDSILIATSDDFGIVSLHVTVKDAAGKLIESGDATPWLDAPDCWSYAATADVPRGTSVVVCVAAIDSLGGVGACSACTTIS